MELRRTFARRRRQLARRDGLARARGEGVPARKNGRASGCSCGRAEEGERRPARASAPPVVLTRTSVSALPARAPQAVAKKVIRAEEWRTKMNKVVVRKEDMNRLVMNYLVTEGYADAARQFSIESGAPITGASSSGGGGGGGGGGAARPGNPAAMDVDQAGGGASVSAVTNIDERMEVRSSVQRGNIEAAIDKVNDINPNILEESDQVYFRLQQQRLIELIRKGEVEEALQFAHDYLAPRGEDNVRFVPSAASPPRPVMRPWPDRESPARLRTGGTTERNRRRSSTSWSAPSRSSPSRRRWSRRCPR